MKISELIKELQEHLEISGDLDVFVPTEWKGYRHMDSVYYCAVSKDKQGKPLEAGIVVEG